MPGSSIGNMLVRATSHVHALSDLVSAHGVAGPVCNAPDFGARKVDEAWPNRCLT